jgi:outer membrane protein TolC
MSVVHRLLFSSPNSVPPLLLIFTLLPLLAGSAWAEPLTFRSALELAARHSGAVVAASADQEKAYQAYVETKSLYLPRMFVGSAIGYSAGFPLSMGGSAPSIFNVTSQQFVLNPAQRSFVNSARAEWQASILAQADQRQQALLDAAVAYVDLSKINLQLRVLRRQQEAAPRLVHIETERIREDVDNSSSLMRAKLIEAQTRIRSAELEGSALQLRKRLADLTGLPEQEIEPIPDSIPPLPDDTPLNAVEEASNNDLRVKIAVEQAHASALRARAEHKLRWPAVDAVGQYALLSRFNNYDEFYKRFERNNGTVGLVVRLGLLDFTQAAHARQADVDAAKAQRQVDAVKSQISAETLRLHTNVEQLTAARDMAQLEYVLAHTDATKLDTNAELGTTTISNQVIGHIVEDGKFGALFDATFELQKAQLQVLNATGNLKKWALGQTPVSPAEQNTISGSVSENFPYIGSKDSQISSLMVAPEITVLPARKSRQFFAVAIGSDGKAKDVTSLARWYSSNDSIAIVSTSGLVSAITPGQVAITATLNGVSESMHITVTEPETEPW